MRTLPVHDRRNSRASGAVALAWELPAQPAGRLQWEPPADVWETGESLVIRAEVAGIGEDDFDVTVYRDAVVLTGRRVRQITAGATFHAVAIETGRFRLEVPLPAPVDGRAVLARLERGLLTVTLPWQKPR